MLFSNQYLNIFPYNPTKFFANWNLEFYKHYNYDDIITLDTAILSPTQFCITEDCIKKTSLRLNRKIHIVFAAIGTGSIIDTLEKNISKLSDYISKITLTDIRDIDLSKWQKIKLTDILFTKKIGDLTDNSFVNSFQADIYYANELWEDIPNRFVYKINDKLYDFRIGVSLNNSKNDSFDNNYKKAINSIYFKKKFPVNFNPRDGKNLNFSVVFPKRIKDIELEKHYSSYPNNCVITIADEAYKIIYSMYRSLSKGGVLLFNDYGFFSEANLQLINDFLRVDNESNKMVRNYYGEFTCDSSYDYLYNKLLIDVDKISIKKTIDRVSELTKIPKPLVNLDGEPRDYTFLVDILRDVFITYNVSGINDTVCFIEEYVKSLNNGKNIINQTIKDILSVTKFPREKDYILLRTLQGYYNYDNYRFLTTEINKF